MTFSESLEKLRVASKTYREESYKFQFDFDQVHLRLMGIKTPLQYELPLDEWFMISWLPKNDGENYKLEFDYVDNDGLYVATSFESCPTHIKKVFHAHILSFIESLCTQLEKHTQDILDR